MVPRWSEPLERRHVPSPRGSYSRHSSRPGPQRPARRASCTLRDAPRGGEGHVDNTEGTATDCRRCPPAGAGSPVTLSTPIGLKAAMVARSSRAVLGVPSRCGRRRSPRRRGRRGRQFRPAPHRGREPLRRPRRRRRSGLDQLPAAPGSSHGHSARGTSTSAGRPGSMAAIPGANPLGRPHRSPAVAEELPIYADRSRQPA